MTYTERADAGIAMLRGKDLACRIEIHFIISKEIKNTPYDRIYHGKGRYEKYKNKPISDIVMEIMNIPYGPK